VYANFLKYGLGHKLIENERATLQITMHMCVSVHDWICLINVLTSR